MILNIDVKIIGTTSVNMCLYEREKKRENCKIIKFTIIVVKIINVNYYWFNEKILFSYINIH